MLEADTTFAERVGSFEQRFGTADADTLSVLAQAAYFCWNNCECQTNLAELCHAIGTGKPTMSYYHCQVSPDRWTEMNTYVVGLQCWLGVTLPMPNEVTTVKVEEIMRWLGRRNRAKEAMVTLMLTQLVDDLMNYVSLARLAGEDDLKSAEYVDFSLWYIRRDGNRYAANHQVAPANGHRWYWKNKSMYAFAEECKQRITHEMRSVPEDAEELIQQILRLSQPPCMHRFSRYQDIKITSIGALKWRGNLPPDDSSKAAWQTFVDDSKKGLSAWIEGISPSGELAMWLHKALGKATDRNIAIVREFLLADSRGDVSISWNWLVPQAQNEGSTAHFIFGGERNGQ